MRWSGYVKQQERIRSCGSPRSCTTSTTWKHCAWRTSSLKKDAAPGVDGETWRHYGENLEDNLQDLSDRLKRGAYRAKPVRRVYIPKADGRQRPLGVPALEDKIVQRAAVEVLNAIYETDFLGFSYGFRPGRSQHQALDALYTGLLTKKGELGARCGHPRLLRWTFDHEWLVKFVEHRIADRRVVRLIQKWLNAGVLEDGKRIRVEEGTPQGGSASPLLGQRLSALRVRPVGPSMASEARARRCDRRAICGRLRGGLSQQSGCRSVPGGTARNDCGSSTWNCIPRRRGCWSSVRLRSTNRQWRGEGKPETFNFLGFTHICVKKRSNGRFTVLRQTIRKRLQAKLNEVKAELQRRMHEPIPEQGKWLQAVVRGHFRYYGVPMNQPALCALSVPSGTALASLRCRGAARTAASFGIACGASSLAGCLCLCLSSLSPAPHGRHHLRQEPDAGDAACPDPWRGL